jgi:hypothetical protein
VQPENFGEAQQLFGLFAVEGPGLSATGERSLGNGEISREIPPREPGDIEEPAYGLPTQAGLDNLHEQCGSMLFTPSALPMRVLAVWARTG